MKRAASLIVAAVVLGSACTPTTEAQRAAAAEPVVDLAQADASVLLSERRADYEEVFEQARAQGFFAGALRGIVLGALLDGERGAVIGAALGAALGTAYSGTAAEQLLQEREEFLNRQQIIENILEASRGATARSAEDAELVSRAVSEYSTPATPLAPDARNDVTRSIATVRQAVEMRALLITELLEETALSPEQQAEVRAEIERQRDALRVIRAQQDVWSAQNNG